MHDRVITLDQVLPAVSCVILTKTVVPSGRFSLPRPVIAELRVSTTVAAKSLPAATWSTVSGLANISCIRVPASNILGDPPNPDTWRDLLLSGVSVVAGGSDSPATARGTQSYSSPSFAGLGPSGSLWSLCEHRVPCSGSGDCWLLQCATSGQPLDRRHGAAINVPRLSPPASLASLCRDWLGLRPGRGLLSPA